MKPRGVDHISVSPILRPAQAARLLGVSRATIYRWEKEGRLAPRVILGPGTSGWKEEDLAAFIAAAPRGGSERVETESREG